MTEEKEDFYEMNRLLARLKRLREEKDFSKYVDSFVSLVSQVNLSDENQVEMFVGGLKNDDKKLIIIFKSQESAASYRFCKSFNAGRRNW